MRALPRVLVALSVARVLASCGSDDFDPAWRVKTFRVLGVVEDPPDARAGDIVRLTAIVGVAPARAARPVSVAWAVCAHLVVDAESGQRACDPAQSVLLTGIAPTLTVPAANGANPWGLFGYACSGGTLGLDAATHAPTCTGGDGFAFVRTLRVRGSTPNHNPGIARITLDGRTLDDGTPGTAPLCVGDRTQCRALPIVVEFAANAREPSPQIQPDGTTLSVPEALVTEFLVDGGDLDGSFRSDGDADLAPGPNPPHRDAFTPPSTAGTVRVWVLVQDGRGGLTAALRTITVGS